MTRKKLEENLGRKMYLRLRGEKEIIKGFLHKSNEEEYNDNPNIHFSPNYYFLTDGDGNCITCLFRVSRIQNYWIAR